MNLIHIGDLTKQLTEAKLTTDAIEVGIALVIFIIFMVIWWKWDKHYF
jgi:hypothetical protein